MIIGFLLWNYVTSQGYVEVTLKVPVEFVNLPDNVEVVGTPSRVEVRVEGAPWAIKKLGPGDVKVQVLLKDANPGYREIALTNVKTPEGVRVVSVRPSKAKVRLVLLKEKEVPVVVRWKRSPPSRWRVSPQSVKIRGPADRVQEVRFIRTYPVDGSLLKSEGRLEVHLVVPRGIRANPDKVFVEVVGNG